MIYLDNSATTKLDPEIAQESLDEVLSLCGNPSSKHYAGSESKQAIEEARNKVATMLGAKSKSMIFTSGGTEANNIILKGMKQPSIWCSAVEHSSVYKNSAEVIPVNENGEVDITYLKELAEKYGIVARDQMIVSVMLANNETGVVTPNINDVCAVCNHYGIHLHIDAVQAVGKIPVFVEDYQVENLSISLSGHKIHGFKGVGALYIHRDKKLKELSPLFGGGSQEFGLRPGTENLLGVINLGKISESINSIEYIEKLYEIKQLRNYLEDQVKEVASVNCAEAVRVPHMTNLFFNKVEDVHLFVDMLDVAGVCVSGGSACSSGMAEHSRVLTNIFGSEDPRVRGSIRISLSKYTTKEEIDAAVVKINEVIRSLDKL